MIRLVELALLKCFPG